MTTKTIAQAGHTIPQYNYGGSGATLVNAGVAGSTTPGNSGVFITGTNNTVVNFGTLLTGGYNGLAAGVLINNVAGNVVINEAGGVIKAAGSVDGNGVEAYHAAATVINAGYITGNIAAGYSGNGVDLNRGGYVGNTGTIEGGGIYAGSNPLTVVNSGKILGNSYYGAVSVYNDSFLYPNSKVTITNQSGGIIASNGAKYGIDIRDEVTTLTNAGSISGGVTLASTTSVEGHTYHFANRVIVDPGAVFSGQVVGGTAAYTTLELGSGTASVSTFTGFGTQFTSFGTLTFDPTSDWNVQVAPSNITPATINGFNRGDTIDLTGFVATNTGTLTGGTSLTLNGSGGPNTLHFGAAVEDFIVTTSGGNTEITTICFCRDTQIGTPNGEVPVQTLKAGDIVLTAHNGPRKVTWVGTGKVLATRGKRGIQTPVIVRRGALGDNLPHQDLHVTKAHSLYIDDVLIPVEFLVNHRTILWDDHAHEVEIYHVELGSHDILIANGVPAESYRDDGNRWLFQNANEGWHLPPQEPYAPVLTGGPVVDTVWRRLLDRAGPRNNLPLTDDPDLHLVIDGGRVDALGRTDSTYVFRLPAAPGSVIVASRVGTPSELGITRDPRSLGVALRRVTIRQGAKFMLLDADDDRLTTGFHGYEPADNLRWTEGYAELPIDAFARFDSGAEVTLHLGGATRYPDDGEGATQAAA